MTRTKKDKKELVKLFLSQSISKTAFCKENQVSLPTLNRWINTYNTPNTCAHAVQFMKVLAPTGDSPVSNPSFGIQIEIKDMTLYLPQTTSAVFLGELLKVVMSTDV